MIDSFGRFYVDRGNRSSHASMVDGKTIGAAGHFRITRSGKIGMVYCTSLDYGISIRDEQHPTVAYVIDAFERHQAFEISPHAYFQFARNRFESFRVTSDGGPVPDSTALEKAFAEEDQGESDGLQFTQIQRQAFDRHAPIVPPRIYIMHRDQDPIDFDSLDEFEVGSPKTPFNLDDTPLTSGRKAFILDEAGRLMIGHGHHLLSGGNPVGAAGQIYVNALGLIDQINLNFSGHYRPPLCSSYARYTYRSLRAHPLLSFDPSCRVTARKNFGINSGLALVQFDIADLTADNDRLEILLGEFDDTEGCARDDDPNDSE